MLNYTIFGESHGQAIGIVISGLPAGHKIDNQIIQSDLNGRKPNNSAASTERRENDEFKFLSGVFNGFTNGSPICAIIENTNAISSDYNPNIPRPNHADLVAHFKHKGFNDYRGGGAFSGRLTAPVVILGSILKQILSPKINITAKVITAAELKENDSSGGIIEFVIKNPPQYIGPSFESVLSEKIFKVGAIKGIEFGDGFTFGTKHGSDVLDEMKFNNEGGLEYLNNHNGGILGGITTGQDIIFRIVVKPTPTINQPVKTVNLETKENIVHTFAGRHDKFIVPRIIPVIKALGYTTIYELLQ